MVGFDIVVEGLAFRWIFTFDEARVDTRRMMLQESLSQTLEPRKSQFKPVDLVSPNEESPIDAWQQIPKT
jgi:hypothetical protein